MIAAYVGIVVIATLLFQLNRAQTDDIITERTLARASSCKADNELRTQIDAQGEALRHVLVTARDASLASEDIDPEDKVRVAAFYNDLIRELPASIAQIDCSYQVKTGLLRKLE
jgi:hypothetical protein